MDSTTTKFNIDEGNLGKKYIVSGEGEVDAAVVLKLVQRADRLLADKFGGPGLVKCATKAKESVIRCAVEVSSTPCYSALWKWVPANYYELTLIERQKLLGARSINQLCKAMLMENKSFNGDITRDFGCSDPHNSRFYLVVVQYTSTIDMKKLENSVRTLKPKSERLSPNNFKFVVASSESNSRLTGYEHGAVSPFGMACPNVPIIFPTEAEAEVNFIYLGGGHVDLKGE